MHCLGNNFYFQGSKDSSVDYGLEWLTALCVTAITWCRPFKNLWAGVFIIVKCVSSAPVSFPFVSDFWLESFIGCWFSAFQSCPALCDSMNCSMPASLSFTTSQSLLRFCPWIGDTSQPSHPLSFPSPPVFYLSQHQGIFQWVGSFLQVAKVLELQLQPQSFQWTLKVESL